MHAQLCYYCAQQLASDAHNTSTTSNRLQCKSMALITMTKLACEANTMHIVPNM
jgi:hypothetical protein